MATLGCTNSVAVIASWQAEIDMVKKIRAEMPSCESTKIIMVSTESSQELIDGLLAEGANGYITKPFTPEKFHEQLSPFMN